MSWDDTLARQLLPALRAQREKPVAAAKVMKLYRGGIGTKKPAPRVMVLATAENNDASTATVHLLKDGDKGLAVKQSFRLRALEDVKLEGQTNASFLFGSSQDAQEHISFASSVQRDVFVAAVRKLQREMADASLAEAHGGRGGAFSTAAPMRTFGVAAVGANKGDERELLTADEDKLLGDVMLAMGGAASDMEAFRRALHGNIATLEDQCSTALVAGERDWEDIQHLVSTTLHKVVELEDKVSYYAKEMQAKSTELKTIEEANNNLEVSKVNMGHLADALQELSGRLRLTPPMQRVIESLIRPGTEALDVFADANDVGNVIAAVKRIEQVLADENVVNEFPIQAVPERLKLFVRYRKLLSEQASRFLMRKIPELGDALLADKNRFSRKGRVVWKPHTAVYAALGPMTPLMGSMRACHRQGHMSALRCYTTTMQGVYRKEVHRFFSHLRKHIIVLAWNETGLLLGNKRSGNTLKDFVESNVTAVTHLAGTMASSTHTSVADGTAQFEFDITLPSSGLTGVSIFRKDGGARLDESTHSTSAATNFTATLTEGTLRCDVAYAMMLESVCDIVLEQENFFRSFFHLPAGSEELHMAMAEVFDADMLGMDEDGGRHTILDHELRAFNLWVLSKCDHLYVVPILSAIRSFLEAVTERKSEMCRDLLLAAQSRMKEGLHQLTSEQVESVRACHFSTDDYALMPYFSKYPTLIRRIDNIHATMNEVFPEEGADAFNEAISEAIFVGLGEATKDSDDPLKNQRNFYNIYRHCAFFCVCYSSFGPHTKDVLAMTYAQMEQRRDTYEEIYVGRVLFAKSFPHLHAFVTAAEDLMKSYKPHEMKFHRAVGTHQVDKLLAVVSEELRKGAKDVIARMKRHSTRGVSGSSSHSRFHRVLLQVTWSHVKRHISRKYHTLQKILAECYDGRELPFPLSHVDDVFHASEDL